MNIAIIGYGKMGKEIKSLAESRGHVISLIIDVDNTNELNPKNVKNIDVAIEFTTPETAVKDYKFCFDNNIPVVSGTTGWLSEYENIIDLCKNKNQTFFYASNFSIGVNILFEVNKYLAKIMNKFKEYDVSIDETHHIHKLDKPSGTAISLANQIINNIDKKNNWELNSTIKENININSFREDEVTGIHKIKYKSDIDEITLSHSAYNRKGFALGAVLAAEFIRNKKGVYSMKDLIDLK